MHKVSFHKGSDDTDAILSDILVTIKRTGQTKSKSSFYFNHCKKNRTCNFLGIDPLKKQRKPDVVPSIFPWRNYNIQGNDERGSRRVARSMKTERTDR